MVVGRDDQGVDGQDVQSFADAGVGVGRDGEAHGARIGSGRLARPTSRPTVNEERLPIEPPETNAPFAPLG
jgi:hypothetical protein